MSGHIFSSLRARLTLLVLLAVFPALLLLVLAAAEQRASAAEQAKAEALRLGLPVTGCTVHRVTPAVDDGPVLARAEVPVLPGDDEAALHERIKVEERRLVVEVVSRLARGSIWGS